VAAVGALIHTGRIMKNQAMATSRPFDVAAIRREFPILAKRKLHYLDSAATAQVPETVMAAVQSFELGMRANVYGGVYRLARDALAEYEQARSQVAHFLGAASAKEVVFTYGTTSAINLLASSLGKRLEPGDEIVISRLEHHSNTLPWRALAGRRGVKLRVLPVTSEGRLDLDALPEHVDKRCRLIALTHCSNVTGAVTDVSKVVAAARSVGARVLLDGAQMAPHGPVDVHALGVDFYAFSGHKTFGPTGIGVLWGRGEFLAELPPFMVGGQMIRRVTLDSVEFADPPRGFEAGTPPIAGAIGLGAALRWMERLDWAAITTHERRLTSRILDWLTRSPSAEIVGPRTMEARRGVVSFTVQGLDSETVCRLMDERNVALRHGHHCAQRLMIEYGIEGTTRVSLAPYVNDDDVDAFLAGLEDISRPTH
jgi:cysteine desulfurase / selenocysteine lyase